jgi:hypothetical protein
LGKLLDCGGRDRVLAQTISKLLDYTIEQHQRHPEGVTAKLRALEEQCGTLSDLLYRKFHRGELGDAEEFFRWDALVEMRQRLNQRLYLSIGRGPPLLHPSTSRWPYSPIDSSVVGPSSSSAPPPGRLKLDIDLQSGLIGITLSAGQAQKG